MLGTFSIILLSVIIVSLISFVGAVTLFAKKKFTDQLLPLFVAFAAGTMLSVAFFDLLPESLSRGHQDSVLLLVMLGLLTFFILERFIFWHHHHFGGHKAHPFTYLNLIGDGVHNFIDGAVIAATFMSDFRLGVVATVAIILHEIPQELGDFSILLYGGLSVAKALFFNFLSALGAVLGAVVTYFFSVSVNGLLPHLLSFAAGGFVYISTADLIPELQKEKQFKKSFLQFCFFLVGVVLIYVFTKVIGE